MTPPPPPVLPTLARRIVVENVFVTGLLFAGQFAAVCSASVASLYLAAAVVDVDARTPSDVVVSNSSTLMPVESRP